MKRIICLALATLLCAAIFVGCGSGESNTGSLNSSSASTTSSDSIKRKNGYNQVQVGRLPHSEQYALNSPKQQDIQKKQLVKLYLIQFYTNLAWIKLTRLYIQKNLRLLN